MCRRNINSIRNISRVLRESQLTWRDCQIVPLDHDSIRHADLELFNPEGDEFNEFSIHAVVFSGRYNNDACTMAEIYFFNFPTAGEYVSYGTYLVEIDFPWQRFMEDELTILLKRALVDLDGQ